jgi:hypothetical protein
MTPLGQCGVGSEVNDDRSAFVAEQRGCGGEGFGAGRPVRFAVTGPLGAERREHSTFERGVVLDAAHDAAGAGRGEAVGGQLPAGGRVDLDGHRAQPVPQRQAHVGESWRDRVAVPSERDSRVRSDDTGHFDGRREREGGQHKQRLAVG